MRPPKTGEHFLDCDDHEALLSPNDRSGLRIIVRPAWQWPSWLKAAAIAMDSDGEWWAYTDVPRAVDDMEWFNTWESCDVYLGGDIIDFTPPPCTDWRQSLRLNPNREAKS